MLTSSYNSLLYYLCLVIPLLPHVYIFYFHFSLLLFIAPIVIFVLPVLCLMQIITLFLFYLDKNTVFSIPYFLLFIVVFLPSTYTYFVLYLSHRLRITLFLTTTSA
uniref:Uncharacterized protein n=1 Tax=Trypanosoma vivax (strain Y486) TaxID=1055687 RepID=G0U175_TRYVY|nr:hypothetical protein TVY486_0804380 [Trypanosoma vivax Y486]